MIFINKTRVFNLKLTFYSESVHYFDKYYKNTFNKEGTSA